MSARPLEHPLFEDGRAGRLSWALAPLLAIWSAVVTAGILGLATVPRAQVMALVLPLVLGSAILLARGPVPVALRLSAAWAALLAAALVAAPQIATRPTYVLAVPGVALAAVAFVRRPVLSVGLMFALAGSYSSLIALTPLPPYQIVDALIAGLAISAVAMLLTGRHDRRVWWWPGAIALGAYVFLSALQILLAHDPNIARDSFHASVWYLLGGLALAYAPWRAGVSQALARAVVAITLLVAGYATLRLLIGPAAAERTLALSDHPDYSFVNGKLVLLGSFPTGHHLAAWTSTVIPFCVGCALVTGGRWRRLSLLACALSVTALLGSQVRAGVAAMFLGLLVVMALYAFARSFPGPRLGTLGLIALALIAFVGVTFYVQGGSAGNRYSNILHPSQDASYQARLFKWHDALNDIAHHPLGHGLGTAGEAQVRLGRFSTLEKNDVDNSYLKIALDQGVPMLALFLAGALGLLVGLGRRAVGTADRSRAGLAMGAAGSLASFLLMIFSGVYIEGLTALAAWMIVGIGVAQFAQMRATAGGSGGRPASVEGPPPAPASRPDPVPAAGATPAPRDGTTTAAGALGPGPRSPAGAATRRLLSVIHGPVYGGGHNQLLRLREPLRARGWETLALAPTDPGNAVARLREAGVEVITMPLSRARATVDPRLHGRLVAGIGPEVRRIRRLLREREIDLVQVHGPLNVHAALAAHREGIAVVWQIDDTRTPMALRRAAMPLVVRIADAMTTVGAELARVHPGADSLGSRVIPVWPPVEAARFTPDPQRREAARRELGLSRDAVAVGTVGNLNPSKGHEYLIRAARTLAAGHPHLAVRLIGGHSPVHGAYERGLHEEAAALGDRLVFVDPGPRVPELMPGLDILVMASVPRSEGIPTVILEAMALGIPVVATDVGAVAEAVEPGVTGYVVAPEDPAALAAAIAPLLDDHALRRVLGEQARRRFLDRFDLGRLADLHARAYETALEHRHSRSTSRRAQTRTPAAQPGLEDHR